MTVSDQTLCIGISLSAVLIQWIISAEHYTSFRRLYIRLWVLLVAGTRLPSCILLHLFFLWGLLRLARRSWILKGSLRLSNRWTELRRGHRMVRLFRERSYDILMETARMHAYITSPWILTTPSLHLHALVNILRLWSVSAEQIAGYQLSSATETRRVGALLGARSIEALSGISKRHSRIYSYFWRLGAW